MVTVDKDDFLARIKAAAYPISNTDSIEIRRNLCFRDGKVMGFDGEIGVVLPSHTDLAGCVPAKRLINIVSSCNSDKLEISQDQSKITINAAGFSASLNFASAIFFPQFLPNKFEDIGEAGDLAEAVESVLFSSKQSQNNRPGGVGIKMNYAYSTDGVRMTRKQLKVPVYSEVSISNSAGKALADFGSPSKLYRSHGVLLGIYASVEMCLTLGISARPFPFAACDKQLDAREGSPQLFDLPDGLSEAIDRVAAVAATTEQSEGVTLTADGCGKLTISKVVSQVGVAREDFPFASPKFQFAISGEYLKDGLLLTHTVDLYNVLYGSCRTLRFVGNGFEHLVGLISLN